MNIFSNFTPPNPTRPFKLKKSMPPQEPEYDKEGVLSFSLEDNLTKFRYFMHYPDNSDIKIRNFNTQINGKTYSSAIIFYDGLVDSNIINNYILRQLMSTQNTEVSKDLKECIVKDILSQNQIDFQQTFDEAIDSALTGNCILLIDSLNVAISCDTKKLPQRSIGKSENEMSTKGPAESLVESLRMNTGLIRKFVKDENLVFEDIKIGSSGKSTCTIAYISSIANDSLKLEVKRRLSNIDVDYILDVGQLEQLIEDRTYLISPVILSTEKPDRVASHLFEGRIAILLAGSPDALVLPAVLNDFMHTSEDMYKRFPYSILARVFRIPAMMLSVLLPGVYIAIVTFHQEMIPTDLLFAIAAAREKVPFPFVVELLIMEIAFEIIREASIRTPSPIGPTLGIVGTLILGQAIVSANVVSPILIIIVALTGISSFAVANFSLNFTFRILRFAYVFLGAFAGFLGISLGLLIHFCVLATTTSFGVPYLAPYSPMHSFFSSSDTANIPIWKQENRPQFLKPKRTKRQPKISRKWILNSKEW